MWTLAPSLDLCHLSALLNDRPCCDTLGLFLGLTRHILQTSWQGPQHNLKIKGWGIPESQWVMIISEMSTQSTQKSHQRCHTSMVALVSPPLICLTYNYSVHIIPKEKPCLSKVLLVWCSNRAVTIFLYHFQGLFTNASYFQCKRKLKLPLRPRLG